MKKRLAARFSSRVAWYGTLGTGDRFGSAVLAMPGMRPVGVETKGEVKHAECSQR